MAHRLDPGDTADESAPSVVATLRQLIVEGHYAPGARLAEIPVAEALGVSRTPVRLAFRTLAQEGLLETVGKRGLVVRAFTDADVRCAVEVRGVLEGLAARRVAESGASTVLLATLRACLDEGEMALANDQLAARDVDRWSDQNRRFHTAIIEAAGSRVIGDAIGRNNHLPFASSDSIAIDRHSLAAEVRKLRVAQLQHRLVVEAIALRESARAEQLMREHAYVGLRYAALFGPAATQTAAADADAERTRR